MRLSGARVVVTGASRGIGKALATELTARGACVVLVARPKRSALFPLIVQAPRRLTEFLLAGVKT